MVGGGFKAVGRGGRALSGWDVYSHRAALRRLRGIREIALGPGGAVVVGAKGSVRKVVVYVDTYDDVCVRMVDV